MLRASAFLVKRSDLSEDAFFAHWRHPHGTLTRRIPHFRRYVQNHRIGDVPDVPTGPWSGVPTIWLDDAQALADAQAHPDYAPLDADGDAFYVRDRTGWLIGSETILQPQSPGAAAMPVKAMLLLADGVSPAAATTLAEAAVAGLDGLAGAVVVLPGDPALPVPGPALVELSFADRGAFDAAWGQGDWLRDVDVRLGSGLLAREERVIWPDTIQGES